MFIYIDETTNRILSCHTKKTNEHTIEIPDNSIDPFNFSFSYYENGKVIYKEEEKILFDNKKIWEEELYRIRAWFSQTDYIPNKIITQEWDENDSRWIQYKNERVLKRQRQDELTLLLNNI